MSGGYFDYKQYDITDLSGAIELLIEKVQSDNHAEFFSSQYSDATLQKFLEAVTALEIAAAYVQRIDWLVSGDDGEDTFHARLKQDLDKINGQSTSKGTTT